MDEVLRELRRLIESACRPDVEAVLQAGHLAIPDPGGACATRESSAFGRSAGSVSPASIDSAVGGLAGGSAPASGLAAGTVAAQPSPRSSRRATRSGDAMSEKIRAQHLARKAVLYVRQSSSFRSCTTWRAGSCSMRCRCGCAIWAGPRSRSSMRISGARWPAPRRAVASSAWSPEELAVLQAAHSVADALRRLRDDGVLARFEALHVYRD
jgi:hypothetical protein